jgi:hypothetical protein
MSVTGVVRNGVVILPPGTVFADGTEVRVETLPERVEERGAEFLQTVKKLAKDRPHLPADYALNHGHYTRGEAKK